MKKIEIKKLKKRTDILEGAYALFTTNGYENTTILNIALRAGVGKGTFYLYFDSKESVRDELIRIKASEVLTQAVADVSGKVEILETELAPVDKFIMLVDRIVDYMIEDTALLKFISKNLSWGLFVDNAGVPEDGVIDFHEFAEDMMARAGVEVCDISTVLFTVLELVSSTCYSTIIRKEPVEIEEYKPFLYGCIRSILGSSIK